MQELKPIDYIVFLTYFFIVAGYGYWIYHRKRKLQADSKDFFLAEGSLTWWAIGASLIASNISAEQFIGMSGSGFKMGLAIATYEWMAAATLIVVAIFFMPIYLKNKIYTMPQFLTQRYNNTVSTVMAVFWLLLYVVVNLTSILYLGALAVSTISGIPFWTCMTGLAIFAIIITLGGMKVIGYTDVIQVFFLILGGLATTYLAMDLVSEHFGTTGVMNGFGTMLDKADDHFHMVFHQDNPSYLDLPGLSILIGGMWIVNLNYWGCNQYITQRALGADLPTARNGILFAAFLKLLMPVIVVLPGIAAYVLYQEGMFQQEMIAGGEVNPDRAYPVLLNLLPPGLKGLAFAALTAAIVASLAGKANSISTIFTLDIYQKFFRKSFSDNTKKLVIKILWPFAIIAGIMMAIISRRVNVYKVIMETAQEWKNTVLHGNDEQKLILVGRFTVIVVMVIAVLISPFLGIDKKGGFQYIQEYTGFVSPGIFAIFILGFFWKRTTSTAALTAAILTFPLSLLLKFLPRIMDLSFLSGMGFSVLGPEGVYEIPFLDRMGFVFLICVTIMVILSLADPKSKNNPKGLEIDATMFKPQGAFAIGAIIICGILSALYIIFW